MPEEDAEEQDPIPYDDNSMKYLVYQLEIGEHRTPHLQGYIEWKTRKSLAQVKRWLPRAHFKIAKGTAKQNEIYCTKPDGQLLGPWTHGAYAKNQGRRTDLEAAAKVAADKGIDACMEEHPGVTIRYYRGLQFVARQHRVRKRKARGWVQPKIRIYYGPSGAGKTRKCYMKYPELYRVSTHTGGNLWLDGYVADTAVLFDDFCGGMPFRLLLQTMDGYPLRLPVKGGFIMLQHEVLLFTTNVAPELWYRKAIENGLDITPMLRRIKEFGKIIYMGMPSPEVISINSALNYGPYIHPVTGLGYNP